MLVRLEKLEEVSKITAPDDFFVNEMTNATLMKYLLEW